MKIKTILAIAVMFFALSACAQGNSKKNNDKTDKVMEIKHLTKSEFLTKVSNFEESPKEWKFLGTKPCIIDFYATWCGPCKALAPILEELSKEYGDQIDVYKVDVDQENEIASVFGIRGVPSMLFVPMEGKPQMSTGLLPKQEIKKAIDKVLLGK